MQLCREFEVYWFLVADDGNFDRQRFGVGILFLLLVLLLTALLLF